MNKKKKSTENLNEYIRIGNTGILLLVAGIVIIVAAVTLWGFAGRIPITTSQTGVVVESEQESHTCVCFVDVTENTGFADEGNPATVTTPDGNTYLGSVAYMENMVISAEEIRAIYSENSPGSVIGLDDWTLDNLLGNGRYYYALMIKTDEDLSGYWHELVGMTAVLREVAPIYYLFG